MIRSASSHTAPACQVQAVCVSFEALNFDQVMDTSDIEGKALCMQVALAG